MSFPLTLDESFLNMTSKCVKLKKINHWFYSPPQKKFKIWPFNRKENKMIRLVTKTALLKSTSSCGIEGESPPRIYFFLKLGN